MELPFEAGMNSEKGFMERLAERAQNQHHNGKKEAFLLSIMIKVADICYSVDLQVFPHTNLYSFRLENFN